jgi:hypothetical protein
VKIVFIYTGRPRHPEIALPTHLWHLIAPAVGRGHEVWVFLHYIPEDVDAISHYMTRLPCNVRTWEEPDRILDEKEYASRMGEGARNLQGCLRQLWVLQRAFEQWRWIDGVKSGEGENDLIVRLRYDLEFTSSPMAIWGYPPAVHIPKFSNFGVTPIGGYNDSFAFGPRKLMGYYFCRYESLEAYWESGLPFHMETHLKWSLDRAQVPVARCGIRYNKVYADGSRGAPVFEKKWGDVVEAKL